MDNLKLYLQTRHCTIYYALKVVYTLLRLRPHDALCGCYQFWKTKKTAVECGRASDALRSVVLSGARLAESLKRRPWFKARLDAIKSRASAGSLTCVQSGDYTDSLMADIKHFDWRKSYSDGQSEYVPKLDVLALISSPEIQVVSFDVFDTLLSRPAVFPTDVFYLIADAVNDRFGVDFIKMRMNAEAEIGDRFITIDEIYKHIGEKFKLASEVVDAIKATELKAESDLLFPRDIVREYYDAAVHAGKRIIAISDMYLPSEFIKSVLVAKGYDKVERVYVSCEEMARKDDGELFKNVLQKENVANSQMFHIGDNRISDFERPIKMGIPSVCVPTIVDVASHPGTLWNYVYGTDGFSKDPMTRILMGCVVKANEKTILETTEKGLLPTKKLMGAIGIAPTAIMAALRAVNDEEIRGRYAMIKFAGRDGYIPQKVYEMFRKAAGEGLPSEYVEAGRLLYYPALKKDYKEFLKIAPPFEDGITVGSYINSLVPNPWKDEIIGKLGDEILESQMADYSNVTRQLMGVKNIIEDYLGTCRKELEQYYGKIFASDTNLVFDCGYSGSISEALYGVLNKKVDKLYLWQDGAGVNREKDRRLGTRTYVVMGLQSQILDTRVHLVFEEIFSPVHRRPFCIKEGKAIYVPEHYDVEMLDALQEFQGALVASAQRVASILGVWSAHLKPLPSNDALRPLVVSLFKSPCCEVKCFTSIKFPDFCLTKDESLAEKIYRCSIIYTNNKLLGLGMLDPNHLCNGNSKTRENVKLGLHIHLFHVDLVWEFVSYAKNLPRGSAIIVTTPFKNQKECIRKIFSAAIPNVEVTVSCSQNRGRDVAPWLVETRDCYNQFDYFCHVHSKKSVHNAETGTCWRRYLLNNLLSAKSIARIVDVFVANPRFGVISPNAYEPILRAFQMFGGPMGSNKNQLDLLMSRIEGKSVQVSCDGLVFSTGTMFWFRPAAMKPLYDLDLQYEDFPEEPIGLDGTLAHAIERAIGFVCEYAGYKVGFLNANS